MARRTSTPKIKWLGYSLTATLHYFRYNLYVNLVNHWLKICVEVICIMPRTTYTSSSFRVSLKLCRKSEDLAYENAENRYPRRPKIDPPGVRSTYAKLKKLNGSIGSCVIMPSR